MQNVTVRMPLPGCLYQYGTVSFVQETRKQGKTGICHAATWRWVQVELKCHENAIIRDAKMRLDRTRTKFVVYCRKINRGSMSAISFAAGH